MKRPEGWIKEIVAVGVILVSCGVAWGTMAQRVSAQEKEIAEVADRVKKLEEKLDALPDQVANRVADRVADRLRGITP